MKTYKIFAYGNEEIFYVCAKDIEDLHTQIERYYDVFDGPYCFQGEVEIIEKN